MPYMWFYVTDIINDCLDQIDDYFKGQMQYDEESIVELLRSNCYNVDEAIDYIIENGISVDDLHKKPVIPKMEAKVISLAPKSTPPKSRWSSYLLIVDTLSSVIGATAVPPKKQQTPVVQSSFTIENDILPSSICQNSITEQRGSASISNRSRPTSM